MLRKITNNHDGKHDDKLTLTTEAALENFSDIVYRTAYGIAGQNADVQDIYQEVFMIFMKYGIKKEYNSWDHAKYWFIRVTVNCFHALNKKAKRQEELEKDSYFQIESEKSTSISNDSEVLEAVQELEENYRVVIHLFYYERYKIKEIAAILEENENTIKTRLSRGKKLLGGKLQKCPLGGKGYGKKA